jgi:hypothetical protein
LRERGRTLADLDARARKHAADIAEELRYDPSLVERARLRRRAH